MAPMNFEYDESVGPHPSFIQVAQAFAFEQQLQECRAALGTNEAREDHIRLQGVAYIDRVRKELTLPIRTYNTACVYYHKFRLVHSDNEYNYLDAAGAALFTACKIEDTLKKSRDILCASWNLSNPADKLSPDDPVFEVPSKTIMGLERLMLEASSFDFRGRCPQEVVIGLCKACKFPARPVSLYAFDICNDLFRTFAPLKQTTSTMAIASVELAARLHNADLTLILGIDYDKWATTRAEVMETLLDLLDLYTHHRTSTLVGPRFAINDFISTRIILNNEATTSGLPRYTESDDAALEKVRNSLASATNGAAGTSSGKPSPQSPLDAPGSATSNVAQLAAGRGSTTTSPASPAEATPRGRGIGERGKDGTVRFMLDANRSKEERARVAQYFQDEWEEVEEEVEVPAEETRNERRDDRFNERRYR